jgi:hypothetical protein
MSAPIESLDHRIFKKWPGSVILDSRLDQARQYFRFLICHEGNLFYVCLRPFENQIWKEQLSRSVLVTCTAEKTSR